MNKKYAYVKDGFVENDKALISIGERGFRFGDGVFETIKIIKSIPCYLELHLKRLQEGLRALKINSVNDVESCIISNALKLIEMNKVNDGFLRISVSRGIGSNGYMPLGYIGDKNSSQSAIKRPVKPLIVIETIDAASRGAASVMANPSSSNSNTRQCKKDDKDTNTRDAEYGKEGVRLFLSSYQKPSSKSLPTFVKTMQGLNSTLARMEAIDNNCFDALLLGDGGQICETSSANIFWFSGDQLYTPNKESSILMGIIRERVIAISPFKVNIGQFQLNHLKDAQEVFITNVALNITSVSKIETIAAEYGITDKTRKLQELLERDIKQYIDSKS